MSTDKKVEQNQDESTGLNPVQKNLTRWFLFNYKYFSKTKEGNGNLVFESELFPSNIELKQLAAKHSDSNINQVVILGWCEFKNKEDFDRFRGA